MRQHSVELYGQRYIVTEHDDGTFELPRELAWMRGWNVALKPAFEPIVLARKPLAGTVAANVLAHGTGAINIDACRIGTESTQRLTHIVGVQQFDGTNHRPSHDDAPTPRLNGSDKGRWPANLVLSHSPECREIGTLRVKGSRVDKPCESDDMNAFAGGGLGGPRGPLGHGDADGMETVPVYECTPDCPVRLLDAQSGVTKSGAMKRTVGAYAGESTTGFLRGSSGPQNQHGDTGGASRFFYCAKASRSERNAGLSHLPSKQTGMMQDDAYEWPGTDEHAPHRTKPAPNFHPCVKPIALMRWLVRMVTPPDGVILDPFLGSGTTGVAARTEGFRFIGIEQNPGYAEIARARIAHADTGDADDDVSSLAAAQAAPVVSVADDDAPADQPDLFSTDDAAE